MAKPPPIPTLKRPSTGVPLDAMAAFVAGGEASPASESQAPVAQPSPALALAPALEEAPTAVGAASPAGEGAGQAEARPRGAKKGKRRVEPRADGTRVRKITVYLAEDLDRQLTLYAATNEIDKSEVVSELLARFLRSRKSEAPPGT